ncbi:response regulator transcription factor [Streptomyces vastus]|uniref:Response regulatory domain-containing protein n=1 Tax=Streptomyces vastus TaxID=285451 RepID=A0ABP6CWG2_9ACTN
MSRSRQTHHLLIAEDESHIASDLSERFTAHGFRTTVVTDGEAARRAAMSGIYDLMVLEIGLPGEDGFTVVTRLRTASSALPVIILTARDAVADTVYGLEGGADDYMTKPFSFDELLARVRLRPPRDRQLRLGTNCSRDARASRCRLRQMTSDS